MLLEAGEILMARALLRADQIRDEDVLTESEHGSWVHINLVTSGTLNFQDGTISGTGDIYGDDLYTDNFMYFGDTTTSGSWRMTISGEDFIHQKYNGSTWETKQTVVG